MAGKIHTFAAVYIGTSEISMKVFEISKGRRVRTIDYLRRRSELGREVMRLSAISAHVMDELCICLQEFRKVMDSYRVESYSAYAGPFLELAKNADFVLEQVRIRTWISATILSNSEQRFISFKSAACRSEFDDRISVGAVVVDIGGDAVQVTLFREGKVLTTQHLILGTLRLREKLQHVAGASLRGYKQEIIELVDKEMESFRFMFLKDCDIRYMILIGDYCTDIMKKVTKREDAVVDTEDFLRYAEKLADRSLPELAEELSLEGGADPRLLPTLLLMKRMAEMLHPTAVWVPGSNISDGIAYDYAQKKKIFTISHDFDKDVLSAAVNMARRYESYSLHVQSQVKLCDVIFDAMKKVHGMGKRERLLLETAAILHDCGKYVSSVDAANCSYNIIMASEFMGLTEQERSVVACAVLYNVHELPAYEAIADTLDYPAYMTVAKLSAILRLTNALDRSHKQKIRFMKAKVVGQELLMHAEVQGVVRLEQTVLASKSQEFELVYGITPILKISRV